MLSQAEHRSDCKTSQYSLKIFVGYSRSGGRNRPKSSVRNQRTRQFIYNTAHNSRPRVGAEIGQTSLRNSVAWFDLLVEMTIRALLGRAA